MKEIDLSIVIPVYNSGACIEKLLQKLTEVLSGLDGAYELVLIDDGSKDDSWSVINRVKDQYPMLRAFQLMRNVGQTKATLCGLEQTAGEIVMTMDDDLQHPPAEIKKLLKALEENPEVDCVLGYFPQKYHSGYRNLASRLIRRINAYAYGLPRDIRSSAFRAFRRQAVEAILAHQTANPAIPVLLFNSTHRVLSIPVEHAERYAGTSNYSIAKQFRLALDNICNATMLPLRVVSALGLMTCALSILLLCYFLVRFLMGLIKVPGWITVVLLLVFFSGMILLSLGVIGEYMVRIVREVRHHPRYFIRDTIGGNRDRE